MSRNHSRVLREGIVSYLRAQDEVQTLVGDPARVYGEAVPPTLTFPFVKYGVPLSVPADFECVSGGRINFALHAFSKTVDTNEVTDIGDELIRQLDENMLPLTDGVFLLELAWTLGHVIKDQDETAAWHNVLQFTAYTGETPTT